jgi:predicted nuclease of predicted toxin-antitoxin system
MNETFARYGRFPSHGSVSAWLRARFRSNWQTRDAHAADEEIMRLAESEGRVVVTFDLDFSRILALQRRTQPSVILIRLAQFSTDGINRLLNNLLTTYAETLQAGAILVVESVSSANSEASDLVCADENSIHVLISPKGSFHVGCCFESLVP